MNKPTLLFQDEPRGPSTLVEVLVAGNGETRVAIPPQDQLRSDPSQIVVIKAIRLITDEVLSNGMLNSAPTAPVAELQKIALTLYCEGWEKGYQIPVLTLNDMALPAGSVPHRYQQTNFSDWKNVSWEKSYLQFAAGTASANAPYVVLFDVQYVKLNAAGHVIQGPS